MYVTIYRASQNKMQALNGYKLGINFNLRSFRTLLRLLASSICFKLEGRVVPLDLFETIYAVQAYFRRLTLTIILN